MAKKVIDKQDEKKFNLVRFLKDNFAQLANEKKLLDSNNTLKLFF